MDDADGGSTGQTSVSLARARSVEEWREAGRKAAQVIRDGGFQLEAAFAAGLKEKTYYAALDGDSEGHTAFQEQVLPALYEQAKEAERRAEADIASSDGGSSAWANWHKWKLEKRYRKLFGDLSKVEVSGPGGGPIQHQHDHYARMSDAELDRVLAKGDGEESE